LFMDGFLGIHDCLVPITGWLGNIFESIRKTGKQAHRVCAMDMRNVLLLLLLLLHNLLEEEVEEYNRENHSEPISDPSDECIQIVWLRWNGIPSIDDAFYQRTRWTSRTYKP
jgi:hypothetical protein